MQREVKPTGLTSLKGLKVSPFNELENSKGAKVKPWIDQNNFVEKNKGVKVNPLNDVKSYTEYKINPNKETDYMENYKPFISERLERYWSNSVPHVRQCTAPYTKKFYWCKCTYFRGRNGRFRSPTPRSEY